MSNELKEKLSAFAKIQARNVYDIDMDTLIKLVVDGGKFIFNELNKK